MHDSYNRSEKLVFCLYRKFSIGQTGHKFSSDHLRIKNLLHEARCVLMKAEAL